MSYLTHTEYMVINPVSELTDDAEFEYLAEKASDIINELTKNRINFFGFDNFSVGTQETIQKATASQIDIINDEGGQSALNGASNFDSLSIGRYSETKSKGTNVSYEVINGVPVSPMVNMYLKPTNLMYKGVNTYQIDSFNI